LDSRHTCVRAALLDGVLSEIFRLAVHYRVVWVVPEDGL